jgi:hypothetical protein
MFAFPLHQLPAGVAIDGVVLPQLRHAPTRVHQNFATQGHNQRSASDRRQIRPGSKPDRILQFIKAAAPTTCAHVVEAFPDIARSEITQSLTMLHREHYLLRSGPRNQYRYTPAQQGGQS